MEEPTRVGHAVAKPERGFSHLTVQDAVDGVGDVAEGRGGGDGVAGDAVAAHGRRGDDPEVAGADERGVGPHHHEPPRAHEDGPELQQRVPLPRPLRHGGLHVEERDLGSPRLRHSSSSARPLPCRRRRARRHLHRCCIGMPQEEGRRRGINRREEARDCVGGRGRRRRGGRWREGRQRWRRGGGGRRNASPRGWRGVEVGVWNREFGLFGWGIGIGMGIGIGIWIWSFYFVGKELVLGRSLKG